MSSIQEYHKIKDSDFDVNMLSQYNLYLHVYINNLDIAVVDTQQDKLLLFEQYDFTETATDVTLLQCLKNIWENHHLLSASLWNKVVVIMVNQEFTFLPTKHYNEDTAIHYLKANCKADWSKQLIRQIKHYELDTVGVFPINQEMATWLSGCYGGAKLQFVHFNSSFLQGIRMDNKDQANQMNILLHDDLMSIVVFGEQQLKFINTFPHRFPKDALYFALFVAEELGLDPGNMNASIWGNARKLPEIQELLSKYIRNVAIGEPPARLKYGDGFEELPTYYAFDLYSAHFLAR